MHHLKKQKTASMGQQLWVIFCLKIIIAWNFAVEVQASEETFFLLAASRFFQKGFII